MAEIPYSPSLGDLIRYSKTIGSADVAVLTAERYLVSVLDALNGTTDFQIPDDEQLSLRGLLSSRLLAGGSDFSAVREYLMKRIEADGDDWMTDGVYMQQQVYKAMEKAQAENKEQLNPDTLLRSILDDPDEYIKSFAADGGKTVAAEKRKKEIEADDPANMENPKEAVTRITEKVKSTRDALLELIFGQDNAVNVFTTGYFQSELLAMTDKERTRPRATFLFAGPPGVGKTYLAKMAAKILNIPFKEFDMSEYSDKEANLEFCGSDKVYKNGSEGNVTSFVKENPRCVLIFDEVEKAHINVIHLFLQVLEDGRLRDNFTDEEISFKDAILIFTTNAGKQLYEDADTLDFSGVSRKVILNALQKDIDPRTDAPYFPPAMCSRFASGNVVMFNYITAHNLREIAKREVLRHAANFEKEVGINVRIDEQTYTALLFAEGASADARTIRGRAESFFDGELFELFRLLASTDAGTRIEDLESIQIRVDLPTDDPELYAFFERNEAYEVLVFASAEVFERCRRESPATKFMHATSIDEAKKILHDREISFVLIDLSFGQTGDVSYLNIEDVESDARDFFWFVRENRADMPIYLLQAAGRELNAEEQHSFLCQGLRGVVSLAGSGQTFDNAIQEINGRIHQQNSMIKLAKANKLIAFETAQTIRDGGKTAEIKLFDFEMTVAVDAEDSENILSSISKPDVHFDQVIGAEDAKKELQYFVTYLKNPKKYLGTGVSTPKGVLLYGPPGTGKTMLAKAMACESDVAFIAAEGNQFVKKYYGEGPDKVRELFRTARKYAPAILFIDEIDAFAKERKGETNGTEETLNALLNEMDGFKNDTTKPVFVLAATNFDVTPGNPKSLDPALMRRFDRRLYVDLPTREERIRFIRGKIAAKKAFEISEEEIDNIAIRSTGMSLADLESVMELSLRTAIRDGNLKVTDAILEEAFETFNSGEVKHWDSSLLERVARHESGHAFLYWQYGDTPSYVTIVARGNHGGYMQHDDDEGKHLYTKEELLAKIRTSLGGRAAEIVYYGEQDGVSTGAGGDLETATYYARRLLCTYGMDDAFGLAVVEPQAATTGEISGKVREAVNRILAEEMQNAVNLIAENRIAVDALVETLLAENHLTGEAIKAVFERFSK